MPGIGEDRPGRLAADPAVIILLPDLIDSILGCEGMIRAEETVYLHRSYDSIFQSTITPTGVLRKEISKKENIPYRRL